MGKFKLDETYIFKISFDYYWAGSLLTTVRYREMFENFLDS